MYIHGQSQNNKFYGRSTVKEQAQNRRNTRLFEYKGIADTLINWCIFFGLNFKRVSSRIYKYHWVFEQAIFTDRYQRVTK